MAVTEKFLDFSVEEYEGRVAKAQELMKEKNLDCLFLTQYENVLYFSGYITWLIRVSKHRPSILIIPAAGKPILIIPELEVPTAPINCWLDDVRGWTNDYVGMWLDAFNELGIKGGTIGAELGEESNMGAPILDWEALKAGLPGTGFVDALDIIYTLRAVKSPKEVEYMREAGRLAGVGCAAAWDVLANAARTGKSVTEIDLSNAMGAAMMAGGSLFTPLMNVRSGPEQGWMHNKYATERVIRPGDWIAMDYGTCYKNYHSDTIRVASFGKPNPEWEKYHNLQLKFVNEIEAAVRPGMTFAELCAVKTEAFAAAGMEEEWPFIGHAVGLNIHELPRVSPTDYVMQPGFCFTCEPGFGIGDSFFCIEDDVIVTETGCEVVTTYPKELFIA